MEFVYKLSFLRSSRRTLSLRRPNSYGTPPQTDRIRPPSDHPQRIRIPRANTHGRCHNASGRRSESTITPLLPLPRLPILGFADRSELLLQATLEHFEIPTKEGRNAGVSVQQHTQYTIQTLKYYSTSLYTRVYTVSHRETCNAVRNTSTTQVLLLQARCLHSS